jgi:hypothetical protein
MSESDWNRLEALVARHGGTASTQARAHGLVLSHLLHELPLAKAEPGPLDWMDWERRKTLRLLLHKGA